MLSSHFPDFTCPYTLRNLKINETDMRNQHVQVNRNLSHHSKHSHSRVRHPLLSIAEFFTAFFFSDLEIPQPEEVITKW